MVVPFYPRGVEVVVHFFLVVDLIYYDYHFHLNVGVLLVVVFFQVAELESK